jgi:hypothetical protein
VSASIGETLRRGSPEAFLEISIDPLNPKKSVPISNLWNYPLNIQIERRGLKRLLYRFNSWSTSLGITTIDARDYAAFSIGEEVTTSRPISGITSPFLVEGLKCTGFYPEKFIQKSRIAPQ